MKVFSKQLNPKCTEIWVSGDAGLIAKAKLKKYDDDYKLNISWVKYNADIHELSDSLEKIWSKAYEFLD